MNILDRPVLETPKICLCKAGDVIRLLAVDQHTPQGAYYMLVRKNTTRVQGSKEGIAANGLWSDQRNHVLVDLATGELHPIPHLSTRVAVYRSATLLVKGPVYEVKLPDSTPTKDEQP